MSRRPEGLSIWIFVAGFLVLGALGLGFLIVAGSPAGDTKPASSPYWEDNPGAPGSSDNSSSGNPDSHNASSAVSGNDSSADDSDGTKVVTGANADDGLEGDSDNTATGRSGSSPKSGASSGGGSSTQDSPPATFPGGQLAPSDVTKVLSSSGSVSLSFRIAEGALGGNPHALVPPLTTKVPPNSSSIIVWVGCAQSSRESLAQVSVSETDRQVTVAAVVLVPANSVGCNSSAAPRELTIPLASPVGNRAVTVVPAGTKLPEVKLG